VLFQICDLTYFKINVDLRQTRGFSFPKIKNVITKTQVYKGGILQGEENRAIGAFMSNQSLSALKNLGLVG